MHVFGWMINDLKHKSRSFFVGSIESSPTFKQTNLMDNTGVTVKHINKTPLTPYPQHISMWPIT